MRVIRSREFSGTRAWDFDHVATFDGVSVKLHWTDQPYIWHVNDGEEVFVVLDGHFDMHVRIDGVEQIHRLNPGDIFHADTGTEHVAKPDGPSRALVIERAESV